MGFLLSCGFQCVTCWDFEKARNWFSSNFSRPELAIPGITQPGYDITVFIEAFVNGRQVDGDIGVGVVEAFNAFWRGNQADKFLRIFTVATAEPPVASIGSRMRHTDTVGATGRRL